MNRPYRRSVLTYMGAATVFVIGMIFMVVMFTG